MPDRSVEAVIEGEAGSVEAMLAWLHTGSPMSTVTAVETTEEEARGEQGLSSGIKGLERNNYDIMHLDSGLLGRPQSQSPRRSAATPRICSIGPANLTQI